MLQNGQKWSFSETERFFIIAFHIYGNAKAARDINNMAASLKKFANITADGFTKITSKMVATRTVALPNHIAVFFFVYLVEARMRANTQRTAKGA